MWEDARIKELCINVCPCDKYFETYLGLNFADELNSYVITLVLLQQSVDTNIPNSSEEKLQN